ncbi:MAG: TonB-dependent receptor [Bacteroidales bacterium]|nr:TonB-dependent receptor [Bacteroidales bacterium]
MKRILPILALFLGLMPLRAQVATVEVSRAYDVNLDGIRKPALPVSVDDSLQRFDVHFDYSIFNRPYSDLYDFTPYETIQLSTVGANRTPYVYTRLGAQYAPGENGVMPAGELYVQSKPRKGFCSGLYGRHNSFFGDLGRGFDAFPVLNTARMENTVGGDLTYDWATGELMFDVKYDFDRYNYTATDGGYPTAVVYPTVAAWPAGYFPTVKHRNNSLTGAFNLNSAQKEENTIYYDVTLSYRDTRKEIVEAVDTARLREGFLRVNGYVGATFDIHRVYVDMNIEYATHTGLHDFQIGVVEFSPIYKYQRKWLDAKLGVKFGTRYGMAGKIEEPGLDLSPRSSIFPDVDLRFTLIDRSLWAHAVVTGGNDLNSFSRMVDDCPIVLPSATMAFGTRPVDATLSLEGVFGGRLGVNLEGNYKISRNKMIFVPVFDETALSQMTPVYRDVNQASVQGEIIWRSQELTVGGRLRYAGYRDAAEKTVVTEMPKWTGNAFFRYNYRERLIAQVECNYRSKTWGGMVDTSLDAGIYGYTSPSYEVPSIVDIDLNVNYLINKHLSVFAKVGNLLNHRNQYMPLYLEPGINFGGGICLNF